MASRLPFQCLFCDKILSTKSNLRVHYVGQHKQIPDTFWDLKEIDKTVVCHMCGSQTTYKNMARHKNKCSERDWTRYTLNPRNESESIDASWDDERAHFKVYLKNQGVVEGVNFYMTHFDKWTAFKDGKIATECYEIVAAVDYFEDYVDSLQSQECRHKATCMFSHVLNFCDKFFETIYSGLDTLGEDFYIARYMESPDRRRALTDVNFDLFDGNFDHIRSFLMTEMLLYTRDIELVKQITTVSIQTAEEQDVNGNYQFKFNEKDYKISKNLKNLIGSFITIANPPNKLFGTGKFKQVEKLPKSVEGCIQRIAKCLRPIKLQKIMALEFEYVE